LLWPFGILKFPFLLGFCRCWCCHQQLCTKPARFSVTCQFVVGDNTNNGAKLFLFLNKKNVIASVARQSRSQCMSALYSYGIAASPQVLIAVLLLNDMAFLTSISNRSTSSDHQKTSSRPEVEDFG
jgi:hypothetical protein